MTTIAEIEALLAAMKAEEATKLAAANARPIFRYAKRSMWKWQIYCLAGFSKDEAVERAKADKNMYTGKWLQASFDGGKTWHDSPPGSMIPEVDETFAVTGKVYGG